MKVVWYHRRCFDDRKCSKSWFSLLTSALGDAAITGIRVLLCGAACVADIVFLVDNSASIRHNERRGVNNWQLILDFVKSIIDEFHIGPQDTRIAVITFGLLSAHCNDSNKEFRQNDASQGAPPKLPIPLGGSGPPSITWFLDPPQVHTPNTHSFISPQKM